MTAENRPRSSFWKWVLNMRLHARIGVAVSVIFSCGIAAGLAARYLPHREIFIWGGSAGLLIAGLLALRRGAEAEAEADSQPASSTFDLDPVEQRPSVFTRRFWGWVALGCAGAVFLAPSPQAKTVANATPPPVVRPKPPVETNEPPIMASAPIAFPELKLQGIHLLPRHPAAIINGKTCTIGDVIAGVAVVQINADSVMVEKDGEKRRLLFAGVPRR